MDVLTMIHEALIADEFIREQASGRIKFFEYPENGTVKAPYIVIDPIDSPEPKDFADNTWLSYDCLFQIDVWSHNRAITNTLADRVRDVMWNKFGFSQKSGPQEYDKGVYRDARRYRGKIYRNDLDGL